MPGGAQSVSGEFRFGEGSQAFSGATAYVRLQDVSRADAPAHIVAEQVIRDISYQPDRPGSVAFQLDGISPDERSRYEVSVHLDVDGDGQVSRGDYINVESYPVLTQGYPRVVNISLRKIK
jgi:uncharacterized lipoprotein YbaY